MQKHRLRQLLDTLPEEVDIEEFVEKARLLEGIDIGERQISASETSTHEEAKRRLHKWLA
jgi:hypothetical protein